ncbi:hypothetical protein TNCV_4428791 [Trichonephila clavipes]|nr:hypothetical protein TNCV_4428791 [Trichonephila clavipes]
MGGDEPNRTVACMALKATVNDRRHLTLCHDEFRGPRSGLCRSGGISNNIHVFPGIGTQALRLFAGLDPKQFNVGIRSKLFGAGCQLRCRPRYETMA